MQAGCTNKALMYACMGIVVIASASGGQQIGDFAAFCNWGETGAWAAITGTGDFFRMDADGWFHDNNVYESSGHTSDGRFVALSNWSGTQSPCAITSTGDYYRWYGGAISYWTYESNIPDEAGYPTNGTFVGLAISTHNGAITDNGDWYRNIGGQWEYAGNIADETGVIPTQKQSLGSVKDLYRQGGQP